MRFVATGADFAANRPSGCSPATAGTRAVAPSPPRFFGMPVSMRPNAPDLRIGTSTRTHFAIVSRRTCWRQAQTCARYSCCSDTVISKRRPSTYTFPASISARRPVLWMRLASTGLEDEHRRHEPAASGGGRHHPQCRRVLPGKKPALDDLAASQGSAGYPALPHGCARRSSRPLLKLRPRRHLIQLVREPALPEVPGQRPPALAACPGRRASAHKIRTCGLHSATGTGATCLAEQEGDLQPAVPLKRGDTAGGRPRSSPSRSGDRLFQRTAQLGSALAVSPACPLCAGCRRAGT